MRFLLLAFLLWWPFLQGLQAGTLTVKIDPKWHHLPLVLDQLGLKNGVENQLSVTRLAMLLSRAELQRESGQWIGAKDWMEFIDASKNRLRFTLNGIPAETFKALRFDIGLDETLDKSDPAKWPAQHPLNPDLNGLHWSWRGQYVFFAIEGRYTQADGQIGGYSYHLAGQPCRSTVMVPLSFDMRRDQILTLSFHADRVFAATHKIDITASDVTHSSDDGGLAVRLADNTTGAFGVVRLELDLAPKVDVSTDAEWKPALIASRIPSHFPQTTFPKDNPLTKEGVKLGEKLFHDPRLSINNTQSCASCHQRTAALSDARRFSIGAEGQVGTRNAMPLFNLAWKPAFFWDGRSPTLREQVLMPIQDTTEMHENLPHVISKLADLAPSFNSAFGSPELTSERVAKALEQFLLTQISGGTKLDQTLTKKAALTEQEQEGFRLFFMESDPGRGVRGADCFHCHGGAHFTNNQFLNNGLDHEATLLDEGLMRTTKKPSDKGRFIVPSLRNVALTAPYMHDGRFATLEEVIEHYNTGLKRSGTLDPNLAKHLRYNGLGLTNDEKAALVAFLKTLTDESFAK